MVENALIMLLGILIGGIGTYIGLIVKITQLAKDIEMLRQMMETQIKYLGGQSVTIQNKMNGMCKDVKHLDNRMSLAEAELQRINQRVAKLENKKQ